MKTHASLLTGRKSHPATLRARGHLARMSKVLESFSLAQRAHASWMRKDEKYERFCANCPAEAGNIPANAGMAGCNDEHVVCGQAAPRDGTEGPGVRQLNGHPSLMTVAT